jgi:hypothetical protein
MVARWLVSGLMVVLLGRSASAEPPSTGLSGIDQALGTTGRIGTYTPQSSSQIAPSQIEPPAAEAGRVARVPEVRPEGDEASRSSDRAAPGPGLAEEELRPTETPVSACRVEVARRRQISPQKLAAKEVMIRFTVKPDGQVRDAEAIAAPGTDLEIAACAKRVLSEWVFAKHPSGLLVVERTYRFR